MFEVQFVRAHEKFTVLRIRTRPAALNVIDAQFVELLRDQELVVRGKADGLALATVPHYGIESKDTQRVPVTRGWRFNDQTISAESGSDVN